MATVNFPFVATENRTLCWLAVAGLRSTLLSKPTARRQVADARMGDEDAAEALSGTGRLEGGVGEALRGESPDAPRVDRVGPVGPGPVIRGRTVFAAAARTAQAGPLRRDHRFPSRGVPRAVSEAAPSSGSAVSRWRAGSNIKVRDGGAQSRSFEARATARPVFFAVFIASRRFR